MFNTSEELREFANRNGKGHLKRWKALSMFETLNALPWLKSDAVERLAFLRDGLIMEGFSYEDVDKINRQYDLNPDTV